MRLGLHRYEFTELTTIGELSIDGKPFCFSLEDKFREVTNVPVETWKVKGSTAIPSGSYVVTITYSNRFKRPLPLLLSVPGFSGIRIHPGNTSEDTEGCVLLGAKPQHSDFLPNSRATFERFFALLEEAEQGGETTTITIYGEPHKGKGISSEIDQG